MCGGCCTDPSLPESCTHRTLRSQPSPPLLRTSRRAEAAPGPAQHRPPLRIAPRAAPALGRKASGAHRPRPGPALRQDGRAPAAQCAARPPDRTASHRPAAGERPRRRRVVPRERRPRRVRGAGRHEAAARNLLVLRGRDRTEPARRGRGALRKERRPRRSGRYLRSADGSCREDPGGAGRALRGDSGAAEAAGAGLRTADAPRSPHCLPLAPTAI